MITYIHIKILNTFQYISKEDISDFEKYQILKKLLYEIDDTLLNPRKAVNK